MAIRAAGFCAWAVIFAMTLASQECAAWQAKPDEKQTAPPSPADSFVKQAQDHVQKLEWDAAIEKCNQGLAADANCQLASIVRGMAYNGKGQFDLAIADFDKVTAQGGRETWMVTNRAEAYANRSFSLYQKGEYIKSIDSAYFALLERGDHLQANNYRAMGYLARNLHTKAINTGNRMIQIDPKSAEGYSHRGAGYEGQGSHDQNIADQTKAIELNANLAMAYQRRAMGYFAKNEKAKAMQDLIQPAGDASDGEDHLRVAEPGAVGQGGQGQVAVRVTEGVAGPCGEGVVDLHLALVTGPAQPVDDGHRPRVAVGVQPMAEAG